MNSSLVSTWWRSAAVIAAVLAAAGCNSDDKLGPRDNGGIEAPANALNVGLEASSLDAPVGSKIGVSLIADAQTQSPLITLQGYLRYDPSQLSYVGEAVDSGAMAMINESAAGRGELRLLALKVPQLARQAATLVFEVKGADYAKGLSFDLEEGSTADGTQLLRANVRKISASAGSAVPAAKHMTTAEWTRHLVAAGYAAEPTVARSGAALTPGAGIKYGDVNLSNTITSGDVTYLGNVSVGNTTLADPATNRDGVLAGNVTPNNGGDGTLVGFSDPCRPGVSCSGGVETGPGDISGADVGQIAQEAVGIDRPVVGVAIPGRTAATNRVIIPAGVYSSSDCLPSGTVPCTWTRDNIYQLDGVVQFDNGVNLVIEEGTRIEGNTAINPNALYIRRNATIQAIGSALAPIVFTCTAATKTKGCWGGVAIGGNAPVNLQQSGAVAAPNNTRNPGGGGNTRELEGPVPMNYGGSNATDNSGTLKYVRIEYAGFIVGTNNELNGLTLGGVGSGTVIDYVQIHAGLDDGIEFFGGTVKPKHLYLTGNSDDSFDWSFGWQGQAQYVIIQQDTLDSDKGLEGDNSEGTGATFTETPRTNGPLYNFTMVGSKFPLSTAGNVVGGVPNNVNDAVHIRRGNWSVLGNSVIASFPVVMDLDDAPTCTNAATDPKVINTTLIANSALGNTDASDPACASGADEDAVLNNAANNNTVVATSVDGQLIRAFDVFSPDFRPIAGSTTATGSTATVPAGMDQTTYRGAVPPATAVTQNNISWYMGWTRGWTSTTAP